MEKGEVEQAWMKKRRQSLLTSSKLWNPAWLMEEMGWFHLSSVY